MTQVEVTNVGGPRPRDGVASEATLADILAAIKKNSTSVGGATKASARAQEAYDKSIVSSTKANQLFNKATRVAEASVTKIASLFKVQSDNLSEFTESIIGNSNMLTRSINSLLRTIDENVDRWRTLSQVGATFNNSLGDILETSIKGRMSLDEFANAVISNSEVLRSFNGSVTQGAVRFADLSRQMRSSEFGKNLYSIGYTFGEVNDLLLSYMDITRRSIFQNRMSDIEILQGSQAYARELERLTKITGMSRQEAQRAMQQQMTDQRIRMITSNMTAEEAANFNRAMAQFETSGLGDIAKRIRVGDFSDTLTNMLRSANPELVKVISNMEGATEAEINNAMVSLRENMDALGLDLGESVSSILMSQGHVVGEMVNLAAGLGNLVKITAEMEAAMREEEKARSSITTLFGGFSDSLRQASSMVLGFFLGLDENGKEIEGGNGLMQALSKLSSAFIKLVSPSEDGSVPSIMESLKNMIQSFVGEDGTLTKAINNITDFISSEEFQTGFDSTIASVTDFVNRFIAGVEALITGEITIGEAIKNGINGIFDGIALAWTSFWEGPHGKALSDTISNYFKNLVDGLIIGINKSTGGMFFGGSAANALRDREAAGQKLSPEERAIVAEADFEERNSLASEAIAGTIWGGAALADWIASPFIDSNLSGGFYDWTRGTGENVVNPSDVFQEDFGVEQRRIGTLNATGMKFEPKDTVSKIHAGERVLNPQETAEYNNTTGSGSQREMMSKLSELNTTMKEVATLMKEEIAIQTKTMRGVRGIGSDMLRGIPQ